jgi:beta-lactamase superfamily II metal-dependent hydrolase
MGIQFEFFKANNGDSILVSTENTNILIDGGVATTYYDEITYSLDKLHNSLDLVVVTHIDTDHICGVIELLNDDSRRDMIDDFWFNTASDKMIIMANDSNEVGGGHGNLLSRFIRSRNITHTNNLYVHENLEDNLFNIGTDIQLTLLSPTKDNLDKLRANWIEDDELKKCQGSSIEVGGSNPPEDRRHIDDLYGLYQDKKIKFGRENSKNNKSSIAFLLKYKNSNFLLLGDSDIQTINSSLKLLGYSKNNRLKVDFVKLSHHGSKNNINDEFLDLVECDMFVIFTNGLDPNTTYRHPDKESLMLILKHEKRAKYIKFLFNYALPIDKKFPFDMDEERKFNFVADNRNFWKSND